MVFVSVRELRNRSAAVWRKLAEEHDLVVTSNGKPIALLSATSENALEEALTTARRARALAAVARLQQTSAQAGTDRLTLREVNAEIRKARRGRPR